MLSLVEGMAMPCSPLLAFPSSQPAWPGCARCARCACRCKRNEVPMEKVFNKSLLSKFLWAMDVEPEFRF